MGDRKPCIRCERTIDAFARICPYCNWDQTQSPPDRSEVRPAAAGYVPPVEQRWRKPVFVVMSFVALLIASFALGSLVHGRDPKVPAEEESALEERGKPAPRANVTLVPDTAPVVEVEEPITSVPVDNPAGTIPSEYQRDDATAVSAAEYAQLAARARAEKAKPLVDPRSITGSPYPVTPPAQPKREPSKVSRVQYTRATPLHQPLPNIRVPRGTTARLQLSVNADGRVTAIDIKKPIPRETSTLIRAVQSWRFKPATVNGQPVSSSVNVDIVFNQDD
ncbi:MAG TPA: TonB family protein [Thermoanaerobaculia bacterium]|nr:TonB family protein [Thermoanaerobaculia bacterium]